MKTFAILMLSLFNLQACGQKVVTSLEARRIADVRYVAHAKALGVDVVKIPQPTVRDRTTDTLFVYIEPSSKRKITVIVEKTGEVADTVEPL